MATLDQVAEIVSALPEAVEGERHGRRAWSVAGQTFAWERQFSKADIRRFGEDPAPEGAIVAVSVADLGEKAAVLGAGYDGLFTIAHFDNYPAVLIQLKRVRKKVLREVLVDGWLSCAPAALVSEYLSR